MKLKDTRHFPFDKYAPFGKYPTMPNPSPSQSEFICGIDAAIRVVGGKWKPLILHFLYRGPHRYGELKRCIRGVSDKMLIQHLKELEAHGIVSRTDHHEVPPRVDYALTPLGKSLAEALIPLCNWGEKNRKTIAAQLEKARDTTAKR